MNHLHQSGMTAGYEWTQNYVPSQEQQEDDEDLPEIDMDALQPKVMFDYSVRMADNDDDGQQAGGYAESTRMQSGESQMF